MLLVIVGGRVAVDGAFTGNLRGIGSNLEAKAAVAGFDIATVGGDNDRMRDIAIYHDVARQTHVRVQVRRRHVAQRLHVPLLRGSLLHRVRPRPLRLHARTLSDPSRHIIVVVRVGRARPGVRGTAEVADRDDVPLPVGGRWAAKAARRDAMHQGPLRWGLQGVPEGRHCVAGGERVRTGENDGAAWEGEGEEKRVRKRR